MSIEFLTQTDSDIDIKELLEKIDECKPENNIFSVIVEEQISNE